MQLLELLILELLALSLFVQGIANNPLTVGDIHSSSDLIRGNKHTGSILISPLDEAILLVGSFSGLYFA